MERGHFNVLVKDQESIVTHYGKHYRVLATLPKGNELYCRVDHVHGERMPTLAEILDVARKDQGVRGKWGHVSSVEWEHNGLTSTDVTFRSMLPKFR